MESPILDCQLCGDQVPLDRAEDHVRVFHPDDYKPLQRWPDGTPVIIDDTLEPKDFR